MKTMLTLPIEKIVLAVTLLLFLFMASAAPAAAYDTNATITGDRLEELQTTLDALPADAGDVRINITQTLFSFQEEIDISVPTDKGITSLTLAHDGTGVVGVYTGGTDLNFFANGIPLIIDNGVNFGKFTTVYRSVDVRVFGGSKNADVTGDTSITINAGGAITGTIFGGGYHGDVDGSTYITAHGAYGAIYGGGFVRPSDTEAAALSADVSGSTNIVADNTVVPEYIANRTHFWVNGSIHGGGHISALGMSSTPQYPDGTPPLPAGCTFSAQVKGGTSIFVDCQISSAYIHGGGNIYCSRKDGGGTLLNADVTGDVEITLGANMRQAADFATDRWVNVVSGGGNASSSTDAPAASAQINGSVTITAIDNAAAATGEGDIGTIMGGGITSGLGSPCDATVNGNVSITTSRKAPLLRTGSTESRMGVVGGGYASYGVANIKGNVNIHICKAPGQSTDYRNVKHLVGGGSARQNGVAQVLGNVNITVDDDIRFEGGWFQAAYDTEKLGITGGGWVCGRGGNADVTGTVTTTIGKGAVFGENGNNALRITGGGRIDPTYAATNAPSAKTGEIFVTLNGTASMLDELFCTSLEGRSPAASATITLRNSHVGWIYDKDITDSVPGNQSVTFNLLGDTTLDYAALGGWDYPKTYNIQVGDGATPTEVTIRDYSIDSWYGSPEQLSFAQLNAHIHNNAKLQKLSGDAMFNNLHDMTIDTGGTWAISNDESLSGTLSGGGTLELLVPEKRVSAIETDAAYNGTLKVKINGTHSAGQVVATTAQSGTTGQFVYDGDAFTIKKIESGGNFDWVLAVPQATSDPAPGEGYAINYIAETITVNDGYEVNTSPDGSGDMVNSGDTVIPGSTLYIRKAAGSLPSGWVALPVPTRPAAPTGLSTVAETIKGKGDGYITGLTADMEYKPANADAWQPGAEANVNLPSEAPCDVRQKATANSFAGEPYRLTIPAGQPLTVTFDAQNGTDPVLIEDLSYNTVITPIATPSRKGYNFKGWYIDAAGSTAWDFTNGVTADLQLYAKWAKQSSSSKPTSHIITASAKAGGQIDPAGRVTVRRNNDQKFTITPDDGYKIADVLVDGKSVGAVQKYTFTNVTATHTIKAVFAAKTPDKPDKTDSWADCRHDRTCPIHPFTDASAAAWYHDGVHYCLENGLMQGYGHKQFAPNDTLTRAMLAQILYNMAQQPAAGGTIAANDVAEGAWYADAIIWANRHDIMRGYGDGNFGPDDPITREQLAAMLWRYAKASGKDVSRGDNANIRRYIDFDQISDWSFSALQWAAGSGIMQGKTNAVLDPQGNATRAEAATMLMRYDTKQPK